MLAHLNHSSPASAGAAVCFTRRATLTAKEASGAIMLSLAH
jgi:hypothetical protein